MTVNALAEYNLIVKKQQSKASKARERLRNHPDTIAFRKKVIEACDNIETQVAYSIQRDLKTMTSMPFYGIPLVKPKMTYSRRELVYAYTDFLLFYDDLAFSRKLLGWLNRNQQQTIRKAAPRRGEKFDIWEHVIPSSVIVKEILIMLKQRSLVGLEHLLHIYEIAGQLGVTKEQDARLSVYKASMPKDWDWRDPDVDPFARHHAVGIR